MDFTEALIGKVSVYLGSADIGVTKETLDGTEVGTVHEEVSGKRMAEGVGCDVLGDAGKFGVFGDDTLDASGGETAVVSGVLFCAGVARVVDKEGVEVVGTGVEVVLQFLGCGVADEDGAVFAAFAADDKLFAL